MKGGTAWIKLKGEEGPFNVWISDIIDKVLIGVVVLESFGFEVDPATGKLKERPLLLYQAKSSIALIGWKLKRISREKLCGESIHSLKNVRRKSLRETSELREK